MRDDAPRGLEPAVRPHGRRPAPLPVALLAVAGFAAAALRFPSAGDAGFPISEADRPGGAAPEASIDLPPGAPAVHAPALAVLPGGELLVAWYAGTREGARDVSIRMARLSGPRVVAEWEALSRPQLERMVQRSVRKLGNPALWAAPDGTVHLFVVSVSLGGWAGSAVNHLRSSDGGRSWSSARRLVLSPFLNLGTLVRSTPIPLDDGGLLLPAYHEFLHKRGLMVRLTSDGRVAGLSRIPGGRELLQPSVAPLDRRRAVALLRSASSASPRAFLSTTEDGGASWSPAVATEIPNRDSGLALLRLPDGRLLAAVDQADGKGGTTLSLLVSGDRGGRWRPVRTVEPGAGGSGRFGYPALAPSPDGTIHLAYSVDRRTIRVRAFSSLSLDPAGGEAGP